MARLTRSSAAAVENPPAQTKKRKRPPSSGTQQRTQSPPPVASVGDQPLNSDLSLKILNILQAADHHGMLDRPCSESQDTLRSVLQHPAPHTLAQLVSLVKSLFPISLKNPRSRPSEPATQQQAFCNLAFSLIEQASIQSIDFPGDLETLIPTESSSSAIHQNPRYALVQHLPSGDYWTSLSFDISPSDLKTLPKGHSELVAILPSPYPSTPISDIPNLGSYHKTPLPPSKHKPPTARKVSSGSFLDYGPIPLSLPPLIRNAQNSSILPEKSPVVATSEKEPEAKPPVDVSAELEELLPHDQLEQIKSGLATLELELAVSELLDRNKRALRRLQELQKQRLLAEGSSSKPGEGSEEWDTAQAILDSLTILASLRPRSSRHSNAPLIPPPTVLRALHQTLPITPSPGWYGNLPPGRTSVLRDDNTLKVKPGVPVSTTPAAPTPTPTPVAPVAGYTYSPYNPYTAMTTATQQSQFRTGAGANAAATAPYLYRPVTTSNTTSYYPNAYAANSSQQVYGSYTASSNTGTTAYGGGAWYSSYNPQSTNGTGTGSGSGGRGTPVNIQQPTSFAPSYSSFFSGSLATTGSSFPTATAAAAAAVASGPSGAAAVGQRTPAVANTVMKPTWNAVSSGTSTPSTPVTLPVHLRSNQNQVVNGTTAAAAGQLSGTMGQLGQQSSFYGYQQSGVTTQFNPTSITSTMSPK
ncbi:hypothetical protein D9757_002147 [Collybiopsis confluens]|uniref:Uncharacterized protein n=1 Tax=Collybiopsis confluens TaxID=2823264 RepID=A0A8H5HZT0_9AGAR|nr:hypothetical protein D9757_002147 [Collybiopsis confluens]